MRRRYARLLGGTPRALAFLALTLPVAVSGFALTLTLLAAGIGTAITYLGIFLVLGSLLLARALGAVERRRLAWAGWPVEGPRWDNDADQDRIGRISRIYGRRDYWLHLLHAVVVGPVQSVFTWTASVVWLAIGFGGSTYWFWSRYLPAPDPDDWHISVVLADFLSPGWSDSFAVTQGDTLVYLISGIAALLTLPAVAHGLVAAHAATAGLLLGDRRHAHSG